MLSKLANFRKFSKLVNSVKATLPAVPAATTSSAAISYRKVSFIKESSEEILTEVPDVNYYVFNESTPYPYQNVPMHEPVSVDLKSVQSTATGKVQYSQLENGLRIASIDRDGLTSQLVLCVNTGPRFEEPAELGVSQMVKSMAFTSTAHLTQLRTVKTLEAIGASASCQVGKEHIIYETAFLREFLPITSTVLTGNVLFPRLLEWEVNSARLAYEQKSKQSDPHETVSELLHATAYHNNTLGRKLELSDSNLDNFTPELIRNFMLKHFSMENSVFVGVNVNHDELCKWLARAFAEYTPVPHTKRDIVSPTYTGGYAILDSSDAHGSAHVAVGFATGGWNSSDLIPSSVLQMLLGGGGTFSTGGPGKGMHSRFYLDVLNKKHFVDHIQSFNTLHSDSGLFGFSVSAPSEYTPKMVQLVTEQLAKVSDVSAEELDRAKNALKGQLYAASENQKSMAEDIARQIIMSGKYTSPREFADLIDNVTVQEIKEFASKMLETPITMVVYGDTKYAPHATQIQKIIQNIKIAK